MKKALLLVAMVLAFGSISAQSALWHEVTADRATGLETIKDKEYSRDQRLYTVDLEAFKQVLANAPESGSGDGLQISLPTIGGAEQFKVWETSNFSPELRAQYPDIKSYVGKGISDPTAYLRFSVAPVIGLQTMVLRADAGAEFIEAYSTDRSVYVLFDSNTRLRNQLPFNCSTDDRAMNLQALDEVNSTLRADNHVFKTFRLALSCTGEYAAFFGGTVNGALAGMNATMTRVNGVFDVDMAVKLELIANDDQVIFTSASSDPYTAVSGGQAPDAWNQQLQTTLTNILGNSAYDIGHLFGASGGGGNAGCIGCVCTNPTTSVPLGKGSGYTSPSNNVPAGDSFDIDFVVHEMGHQLGATHTFSYGIEGAGVNTEPGSGVTIMAYAGVAPQPEWNVEGHSIPIFGYRSILQMQSNLNSKTCSVNTSLTGVNAPPTVSAGPDFTIPKGTAFILKGSGSDPDGDALTFVWEENDNANGSVTGDNSLPSPDKTVGPNFRTFNPTASPDRFMPKFSTVLAGSLQNGWEAISEVGRTLTFNFTARDNHPNGGQTKKDANTITVSDEIGPFQVTSQNTSGTNWTQLGTETVTWDVNGANTLVGSTNVNIKLSTDGGLTFPYILASDTPNDGSETITVPDVDDSTNCRIWIEPTGNIYYALNQQPFSIGYSCNRTVIAPNLIIPDGNSGTATSTITISDVATINNMKVYLQMEHSYIGDVIIRLKHPNNTQRTLWNRGCNSGAFAGVNVNLTFQDGGTVINTASCPTVGNGGTFAPNQTLSVFNGLPTNGTWTLSAQDMAYYDTGRVISWGLDFGCTLGSAQFDESNFSIYPNPSNGSFTVEYTSPVAGDVNISVHDIRGRKVFENKYTNTGMFMQTIAMSNAEAGIYLVTVQDGNKKMVKKMIVQ